MPYKTARNVEERFWAKVRVGTTSECWPWQGSRHNRLPYGLFRVSRDPRDSPKPAHRISWQLANGPIPAGMFVCHRCDNPPCVNPAHLFLGTPAENLADMRAKGRGPKPLRGENGTKAKLREDDVRNIRRRVAAGEMQKSLADEYGVSKAAVNLIVLRKNWKHVG